MNFYSVIFLAIATTAAPGDCRQGQACPAGQSCSYGGVCAPPPNPVTERDNSF